MAHVCVREHGRTGERESGRVCSFDVIATISNSVLIPSAAFGRERYNVSRNKNILLRNSASSRVRVSRSPESRSVV